MKYIALLRGINISGKNKISMKELKSELENNKYQNVTTYLNSGNIIFESDLDQETLMKDIHNILKKKFDLEIPVYIISGSELEDILNHHPDWWGNDNKEIYDNLIFIIPPTQYDEVYNVFGEPTKDIEIIREYKNCIFWSYSLKDYRKSSWWKKTASTYIKDQITIRTARTMRKVLEICKR